MVAYIFEYIWVGGNNELRSKTKVVKTIFDSDKTSDMNKLLSIAGEWNYDGSSTKQASGSDSEVILKPVCCRSNPFHKGKYDGNSYLLLCETYLPNGEPHPTNTRYIADSIFKNQKAIESKSMFGIELEFFVVDSKTGYPLGFSSDGSGKAQGPYYCGVGEGNCYGRQFLEECVEKSLDAQLSITGSNFEVCCGQMELQVCNMGITAGDEIMLLKYILARVGEYYGYTMNYDAKPVKGDWNGSGCHINYSSEKMRQNGGIIHIINAIGKLKEKHMEHIKVYGSDNAERLTGEHETSPINEFSYGVANRGASIRIPRTTDKNGYGYFEDRRPASSCDIYLATSKIFETCEL